MGPTIVMRATGVLLVASTIVNAVWFVAAADDGSIHVRLGVAGALAVGVLWSARARSRSRSAVRSVVIAVVLLLGCVAAFYAWVDVASGRAPFASFVDLVRPDPEAEQFAPAYRLNTWIVIDDQVALGWAFTLASVFVAAGAGPVAWLRRGRGRMHRRDLWLYVPFAGLMLGALVSGALTAAALAVIAAVWLDRALAHERLSCPVEGAAAPAATAAA